MLLLLKLKDAFNVCQKKKKSVHKPNALSGNPLSLVRFAEKSFGTDSAMNTNDFSNTYSKSTNHFSRRVLLNRVMSKHSTNAI